MCVYAIKEMGTECFYRYHCCETAALELLWRRTVLPNHYLPPSTLRTPLQLHCHCCPLHPRLYTLLVWGTDWCVWFPPCLASMMCLTLLCHVCTVTLMLNHASSQKCNGFASKTLWRVQVFLSIGSRRLWHFWCKLTTVRVPLVKPPYNYLQMLAPTVWPVCVEGQDGASL